MMMMRTASSQSQPALSPFRTAVLAVTEWLTLVAVLVVGASLATAALLAVVDGRFSVSRMRRSAAAAWSLRGVAALLCASVAAAYYAEARFSVVVSYAAAATRNPLVRLWLDADQMHPCGDCHHFLLWVYAACALVACCVALAAAELVLSNGHSTAHPHARAHTHAAVAGTRRGALLWHIRNKKLELVLVLVLVGSIGVAVGRTIDRAGVHDFGAGWEPQQHSNRTFSQHMLERSSLYAGMAALVPMSLIGIPLSRTSPLWRALGRSYEEAIAFHRALGHLMMGLLTYHSVGYMVEWSSHGLTRLFEELTDWLNCGRCTHINNLAGLVAFGVGLLIWLSSFPCFRRRNYAAFFNAHQLHLAFFVFACIHWPACLTYAAPTIVFYCADLALRRHLSRARVPVGARIRPSAAEPIITTLVIAGPPNDAHAPPRAAASVCGKDAAALMPVGEVGERWSGSCVYLAAPALGWLPYLQWHPFSAIQHGTSLVVHVSRCARWTRHLARLVAASPPAVDGDADADDAHGGCDRTLSLWVIGPIPAPPALLECVSGARAGRPLVLVGGGSGIVPLVAILRRLACGHVPSDAHVRLVVAVRDVCALEQLMDGRLLPLNDGNGGTGYPFNDSSGGTGYPFNDSMGGTGYQFNDSMGGTGYPFKDSTGGTGYPWLRTHIFVTAQRRAATRGGGGGEHGAAGGDGRDGRRAEDGRASMRCSRTDAASNRRSLNPTQEAQLRGPFRVEHVAGEPGSLRATAAPLHHPPVVAGGGRVEVPLPVYEAASLVGAVAGFMVTAWSLMWRDSEAPWARHMASTSVTGGGGSLVSTTCAFAAAALLLELCGCGARLVRWLHPFRALRRRSGSPPFRAAACGWSIALSTRDAAMPASSSTDGIGVGPSAEPSVALKMSQLQTAVVEDEGVDRTQQDERSCFGDGECCRKPHKRKGTDSLSAHSSSLNGLAARVVVNVPIAGWARPDMDALIRHSPPAACVAAGGPAAMLKALDASLAKAGRTPCVRLTQSL